AAFALAKFGEAPVEFLLDSIPTAPTGEEAHNLIAALATARETAAKELLDRVEREKNPQSRARYAITLLHLGDPRGAEQVLALAADPTYRTAFIHGFPAWHGDLQLLPDLLRERDNPAFRSGLCAALGLVDPNTLRASDGAAVVGASRPFYVKAEEGAPPRPAGGARRQWKEVLPPLPAAPRRKGWFVNRSQMTMLRIQPGTFSTVNRH